MKRLKVNIIIALVIVLSSSSFISCVNNDNATLADDENTRNDIKENEIDKDSSNIESTESTKNTLNKSNLNDSNNKKEGSTTDNTNAKLKYPIFENEKIDKLIETYIK